MNEIEDKIDELFDDLEDSKIYKDYLSVKKQLNDNSEIMDLIKEIKRYQKIYVNEKDKKVKTKIDEMYNKLNSYPIYISYIEIKEELENTLKMISDTFSNYFKDILEL